VTRSTRRALAVGLAGFVVGLVLSRGWLVPPSGRVGPLPLWADLVASVTLGLVAMRLRVVSRSWWR